MAIRTSCKRSIDGKDAQKAPVESGVFGKESKEGRLTVGAYACCSWIGDRGLAGKTDATLLVSE